MPFFIFAAFFVIIHQTHYEKSDWSRAFNQFTIARELDMINAVQYSKVSVADITVPVKGIAALHARIARALHAHYTQCSRSSHAVSTHLTRKYTKMRVITRM